MRGELSSSASAKPASISECIESLASKEMLDVKAAKRTLKVHSVDIRIINMVRLANKLNVNGLCRMKITSQVHQLVKFS